MEETDNIKLIARNRKALRDFDIKDRFEAGIELVGAEVKSLREGKINLGDAYAFVERGQLILKNLHITPYKMAGQADLDPMRPRRLLMHRAEINRLAAKIEQRGMTLVLLSIYFKRRLAKVELGLGQGRRKYDKRQVIAKADADRRIKQAIKRDQNQ